MGVFVRQALNRKGFLDLLERDRPSFAVIIAMAIKYKLPILLIPDEAGYRLGYENGCREFLEFVSLYQERLFSCLENIDPKYFKNFRPSDITEAILELVRPMIVSAGRSKLEIIRPATANNL